MTWLCISKSRNGICTIRPHPAQRFRRIERIAHVAHGEYWKVTDRANTVTVYGRSAAARIAAPADVRRIFRWLPEFSYDNKGNWIAHEYKAENSANMLATSAETNRLGGLAPFANSYLKRIHYGNRAPYHPDGHRGRPTVAAKNLRINRLFLPRCG